MSAINTKIEAMTRQRTLTIIVAAYAYAALIVAGPWIFTMVGVSGLSSARCFPDCSELPLFRSIVIYNSLFSLVVTSPMAFLVGRYIADRLYIGRSECVFPAFIGVSGLFCLITAITIVPFYFLFADLEGATRFAAVQNAFVIGISWLLLPFLGVVHAYKAILLAFASNALLMILLGSLSSNPTVTEQLLYLNISFTATDILLFGRLVRQFGTQVELDPQLFEFLKSRWELPFAGLAYAVGIWSDKVVMWFGVPDGGLVLAGTLHTMPSYDTAMFWAQLSSIPVIAVAFVHIETQLNYHFQRLYGRLGQHASLRELAATMRKLRNCVIASIATLFVAMGIVAVMMILVSFVFMNELGLRPSYMSILRVAACATAFHTSLMFCFVFFLYFDLRAQALAAVGGYALMSPLLTLMLLPLGPTFYGYGIMIAAAISFVGAFAVLLRELPWLHYHAIVTNNTSLRLKT